MVGYKASNVAVDKQLMHPGRFHCREKQICWSHWEETEIAEPRELESVCYPVGWWMQ